MQATMNCDSQQENNDMQNSFSIESRILEAIRQKILMFRYELDDAKIKCYDAKHDQSIHWFNVPIKNNLFSKYASSLSNGKI